MAMEQVRMWRPADEGRVLLMAGQTSRYAMEPRGEYVFGIVAAKPMLSRRRRERRLVEPGQLVAWDPSNRHAGTAVDAQPWSARLMVVDVTDLAGLASDQESDFQAGVLFPEPVIRDPEHARVPADAHSARDDRDPARARRTTRHLAPRGDPALLDCPPAAITAQPP
jgi:AraC-like ligand binding domain